MRNNIHAAQDWGREDRRAASRNRVIIKRMQSAQESLLTEADASRAS